jgi:predicted membrane-bound spermidine synthase
MIRQMALLLTVLTGFSGLVYEVVWQKYLATLLGSHGEATAAVLAIFLGGLSVGYAVFGRATRWIVERARRRSRPARLLYFYALVEVGIGLYALLFPTLFSVAHALSLLGPSDHAGLGFAFDIGLSALLIGPPTVLMGGTIPILTLALAGDAERATRVHAWVYGCNTAGAFSGALAGGFVLIPLLGLDQVVYAMGCVNLFAALGFAQLDRGAERVGPDLSKPSAAQPVARFAAWAGVSLLAGFAMMTLQTTFNRIGALALGPSLFTFAMVVAVFVLCIALGSLGVAALTRIPRSLLVGSQWALVVLLFPLYLGIADATYWAHVIRVLFRSVDAAFWVYYLVTFGAVFAVLVVPIGLSGALLPLLFHELRREVRDLGSVAGRLYAWNTFGSLLGALLGGYVLLFWLDLHHVYRIAMAALALAASLLTLLVLRPQPRALPLLILLPTLAAIWLMPPWSPERLSAGLFRGRAPQAASFLGPDEFFERLHWGEVIFYDDDPVSSVAVLKPNARPNAPRQQLDDRTIVVNGKTDGSLRGDYATMALSALLPALMAERHERCFVIGWGTGVTAGELAALEETREVIVAEISRGVIAGAPLFDAGNLAASKSPKVEIRNGDAYRTLLQSPDRYDVIISEPSNPWVTGVEMLYSREFLEAARGRLRPGGVYGQWFHTYETDVEVVELVLRTYADVFPYVSVWFTLGSDLLLLGFDRPDRALDVRALAQRFGRRDFAAGFAREGVEINSFPQLLAHELLPLGTLHAADLPGDIHSLRHPILSYRAARAYFLGRMALLPPYTTEAHQRVATRNSLLRRLARDSGALPEDVLETAARETCRFSRREECATFFARWGVDYPASPRRRSALAAARQNTARPNPYLTPDNLAGLQALFGGKIRAVPDGALRMQAEQMTKRFLRHYHHAVPFDRDILEAAWSRCRGDKCEERRRLAEQRLGWIDADFSEREDRVGAAPRGATDPETFPPELDTQTQGVSHHGTPE